MTSGEVFLTGCVCGSNNDRDRDDNDDYNTFYLTPFITISTAFMLEWWSLPCRTRLKIQKGHLRGPLALPDNPRRGTPELTRDNQSQHYDMAVLNGKWRVSQILHALLCDT